MKSIFLTLIVILILFALIAICCACLVIGVELWTIIIDMDNEATIKSTPSRSIFPSKTYTPKQPTQTQIHQVTPAEELDTLTILEQTFIPANDLFDLARRFERKTNLPEALEFPVSTYQVGDQTTFWVNNSDINEYLQVNATLRYIGEHMYFWIENGVTYNVGHLKALAEAFDQKIYPTNRTFFGSEWNPGVDADPRLYILYTSGLGKIVSGYFSPYDEYLPLVREYSNGHEMFFLNADNLDLNQQYTYGVLAHEFQHMIHWAIDRNEDSWLNEGFSDLAEFLNGYTVGGHDDYFAKDVDIQLNYWPPDQENSIAHYGASFLFVTYFLDRFGVDLTKALIANPTNGLQSIDEVLKAYEVTDPLNGNLIQADDFFTDWVIASFLHDPTVTDGRFAYKNYPNAPETRITESIYSCPTESDWREVSQYGADLIRITCPGEYTLHFEGSTAVSVLPADPHSGEYYFYSNRADEADMSLTHTFDFTAYNAPLTLTYWTWYDLEKDYDYVYLLASTDGETWEILTTPSGTAEDPSGNSYGWAYNGLSGDGPVWIQETVDLSQFAGRKVHLAFEYVTDPVANGEGFLLDDIAIPEIGYSSDFEDDDGGWQANGFVRIVNILPQTFRLTLIHLAQQTIVEYIQLPMDNIIDIPISIQGNDEIILAISGTTRFTNQKALYQFNIQR